MAGINLTLHSPIWRPPSDVFETEQAVVLRIEIAGLRQGELKIELNGRTLTVRGNRLDSPVGRAYHQMEIHFGEFSLEFELPAAVAAEMVSTEYEAGFLWLTLPKLGADPSSSSVIK